MIDRELWEGAVRFHGHECGGLALGVRAAVEAQRLFGVKRAEDEEIVCVTENDACGVDGIQYVLGCTMGKGNLIYRGTGKFAFSFFSRSTGKKFRIYAKDKKENISGDSYIEYVLTAPADEIFDIGEPKISVPEKARALNSVRCSVCGEKAAENRMRVLDGKPVCVDCWREAGGDYDRGW